MCPVRSADLPILRENAAIHGVITKEWYYCWSLVLVKAFTALDTFERRATYSNQKTTGSRNATMAAQAP